MERPDALANSSMAGNRPTAATGRLLEDELLSQRAMRTCPWALPLVMAAGGGCVTHGTGWREVTCGPAPGGRRGMAG